MNYSDIIAILMCDDTHGTHALAQLWLDCMPTEEVTYLTFQSVLVPADMRPTLRCAA